MIFSNRCVDRLTDFVALNWGKVFEWIIGFRRLSIISHLSQTRIPPSLLVVVDGGAEESMFDFGDNQRCQLTRRRGHTHADTVGGDTGVVGVCLEQKQK